MFLAIFVQFLLPLGLLMTACDLGAITKPWEIQKKVAKKIEDEFYFQVRHSRVHICPM